MRSGAGRGRTRAARRSCSAARDGQDGGQFSTSLEPRFPAGREMSRDFLEISPDSGLFGRIWEQVTKRDQ